MKQKLCLEYHTLLALFPEAVEHKLSPRNSTTVYRKTPSAKFFLNKRVWEGSWGAITAKPKQPKKDNLNLSNLIESLQAVFIKVAICSSCRGASDEVGFWFILHLPGQSNRLRGYPKINQWKSNTYSLDQFAQVWYSRTLLSQAEHTLHYDVLLLLKMCKSKPLINSLFIQCKALLDSTKEAYYSFLVYTVHHTSAEVDDM